MDMMKEGVTMLIKDIEPFQLLLKDPCEGEGDILRRKAVRALAEQEGRLLMVRTAKGDYKFPGGGINGGEDPEGALRREVEEETGYLVDAIRPLIETFERRPDYLDEENCFEMTSYYYAASIREETGEQKLDPYEADLDFTPVLIRLEEAYRANLDVLDNQADPNSWVRRETKILRKLLERLGRLEADQDEANHKERG